MDYEATRASVKIRKDRPSFKFGHQDSGNISLANDTSGQRMELTPSTRRGRTVRQLIQEQAGQPLGRL